MFYHPDDNDLKDYTIDAPWFDSQGLRQDIEHLIEQVAEEDKKNQLLERGAFVIAIQGSWGSGKSTAARILANHIEEQMTDKKFYKYHHDLLSFGNINESIASILGDIADDLYKNNVVNVRSEFRQMAIDAVPASEVNAGVQLLGLSLSRTFMISTHYTHSKKKLQAKLLLATQKGHRFVVTLDDLDRMKPAEVIMVIRMVENFKDIPGIVFVLPFYRQAVANSIKEELKLDDLSSRVFLRKLLKASVSIDLTINNLKHSFTNHFTHNGQGENGVRGRFSMGVAELAWYVLLHVIIVRDTIAAIGKPPTGIAIAEHHSNEVSSYLFMLAKQLEESTRGAADPLPYFTDRKLKRFADVFPGLLNPTSSAEDTLSDLNSLLNSELLTDAIFTNTGLYGQLLENPEIAYDEEAEVALMRLQHETVFKRVFLPLLKKTDHELKLTGFYSRRDIEQLAKSICNDSKFKIVNDPDAFLKLLIEITVKRFEEFR